MKKFSSIIFFLTLNVSLIFAHGQGAHQHMVREAYKLLKNYIGQDIREMKDHVGYNQTVKGNFK